MAASGDLGSGLQRMLDAVPTRVWLLDAGHRVVWANRQAAALLGRTVDEVTGLTLVEIFGPDRAGDDIDRREAALRGETGVWAGWSTYSDGTRRFTERHFLPHEGPDGGIDGYYEFTSDQTELMSAREAADRAERMLRDAIAALPDGLGIEGRDGRLAACNPAYEAIYGIPAAVLIGMSFEERMQLIKDRFVPLINAPIGSDPMEAFRRLVQLRRESLEPFEARHADGRDFLVQRAPTAEGGRVVLLTDITKLRAQEAELARQRETLHQAEKLAALGEVLAGVSHELNNPLSVLVGQAAILLETAPDETVRRRAERLSEAAARCARIVRSFLAMARQRPTEVSRVDLGTLIRQALVVASPEILAAEADARLDLPQIPVHAVGDAEQLRQVLVNLLVNAAQALTGRPAPRRIAVSVRGRPNDGMVEVRVSDTGPGVPADIASRIFDPLFTTKAGKGSGIGLALCHRIVTAHGGRITAGGEAAGGATFVVELPLADAGLPEETEAPYVAPAGGLTLLVLDDDEDVLRTTSELLQLDGHRVVPARGAREALALIAGMEPDAVISDVRMPDMDGIAFYRLLEARKPRLARRFVFATGDTLSADVARSIRDIGRPIVEKPFLPDDIRAILREIVPIRRA